MKLAIMQPYFMPYIGYFQLINTVDKFIFYDEVTFIKKGWINRNRMLLNNQPKMFTIPLTNASSNNLIKDVLISDDKYKEWRRSFLRSLMFSYKKAKNYNKVQPLIENVLSGSPKHISDLAIKSVMEVSKYLELQTEFETYTQDSGVIYDSAQDRVLSICSREQATIYINPIGGTELYSVSDFEKKNIELYFLQSSKSIYKQFSNEFVPFLSIIDILMFNDKKEIINMFENFELV
jgi:hypothetical protein